MNPVDYKYYPINNPIPSIAYRVELSYPNAPVFDVSERLTSEPGIVDGADYRENLTYMNEIVLQLNDADHAVSDFLTAARHKIIINVFTYPNEKNGIDRKAKKYGGYIDLNKSKPDADKKYISLFAYPYLGEAERTSGKVLTTQYADEKGLIIHKLGLWITDSNIPLKVLQPGDHKITTQIDGLYHYAKLDNGEFVYLPYFGEFTLYNKDSSEAVKILFSGESFIQGEALIYTETAGEARTFFYDEPLENIVKKCFQEAGCYESFFERYEIETYNGRSVLSKMKALGFDTLSQQIIALTGDGTNRIFFSTAETVTPYRNSVWEYNYELDELTKIYFTTVTDYTGYKLIWDPNDNILLGFIDNKDEDIYRGLIQKFEKLNNIWGYTTIFTNSQYSNFNAFERFHYSRRLKKFLVTGVDGANYVIRTVGLNGAMVSLITDNDIVINGACWLDEREGLDTSFYFIKNMSGTKKLYKTTYDAVNEAWSAATLVYNWFSQTEYESFYCYPTNAGKTFITKREVYSGFFDMDNPGFNADLRPAGFDLLSPYELEGELYIIAANDTNEQRVGFITIGSEVLNLETGLFDDYKIIYGPYLHHEKFFKFYNIYDKVDLAVASSLPGILLRYSKYVVPFVSGEYDTSNKTIRDVLQELANNFLAFIKIDSENKGYYLSRLNSGTENILNIEKTFIKNRVTERVYSEKYDRVVINSDSWNDYGDRTIGKKILNLDLQLIDLRIIKDMAKYFYDYYSVTRKLISFSYVPVYYQYESLDKADMSEFGYGICRIHEVSPKRGEMNFKVLTNG